MKTVLALAFLAVAQATFLGDASPVSDEFVISPMMTRAMFLKYGFVKPALDSSFVTFARSMGAFDYPTMGHLRSLYDEPAVMFFMDSFDNVVSYYADAGIEKAMLSPELRAVFPSVLGAADSMAIVYQPESFLGSYKSLLPGHFFVPSHGSGLVKIMRSGLDSFPMPVQHAIFRKAEIADIYPEAAPVFAKFNIDEFPYAFKSPVSLRLFDVDHSVGLPYSSFYAKSALPMFGASHLPMIGASHLPMFAKAAYPFQTSFPAFYKSFPAVRSEIPAEQFGYIPDLKFPMFKHFAAYEPVVYAKQAYKLMPYTSSIAPITTVAPVASPIVEAASPIVEAASPIASPDVRSYFPILHSSPEFSSRFLPSFYPSYYPAAAPAIRFSPFAPSPIAPISPFSAVPAAAGASAASMASASSAAGAESVFI